MISYVGETFKLEQDYARSFWDEMKNILLIKKLFYNEKHQSGAFLAGVVFDHIRLLLCEPNTLQMIPHRTTITLDV